jgi:predicted 3-demethylubiquinone-9 3-methyltransferase (glyoxalase superfamily)
MAEITPFLTFDDQAEAAVQHYLGIFDGRVTNTIRMGEGGPVLGLSFELLGRTFQALNGGPGFSKFTEAFSIFVTCETQEEIDRYWGKLTAGGGKESRCGWLTDKFGVSWQIVPRQLGSLIGAPGEKGQRAMQAMLTMRKLDMAALTRAYEGA